MNSNTVRSMPSPVAYRRKARALGQLGQTDPLRAEIHARDRKSAVATKQNASYSRSAGAVNLPTGTRRGLGLYYSVEGRGGSRSGSAIAQSCGGRTQMRGSGPRKGYRREEKNVLPESGRGERVVAWLVLLASMRAQEATGPRPRLLGTGQTGMSVLCRASQVPRRAGPGHQLTDSAILTVRHTCAAARNLASPSWAQTCFRYRCGGLRKIREALMR